MKQTLTIKKETQLGFDVAYTLVLTRGNYKCYLPKRSKCITHIFSPGDCYKDQTTFESIVDDLHLQAFPPIDHALEMYWQLFQKTPNVYIKRVHKSHNSYGETTFKYALYLVFASMEDMTVFNLL